MLMQVCVFVFLSNSSLLSWTSFQTCPFSVILICISFSSSRRKLFLGAFSFLPSLSLNHPAAGSGNVLKVQQLLHICSEHFDSKEKEEDKDKKEKKEKDKKEAPADMGAHQVPWAAGHSGGS